MKIRKLHNYDVVIDVEVVPLFDCDKYVYTDHDWLKTSFGSAQLADKLRYFSSCVKTACDK